MGLVLQELAYQLRCSALEPGLQLKLVPQLMLGSVLGLVRMLEPGLGSQLRLELVLELVLELEPGLELGSGL